MTKRYAEDIIRIVGIDPNQSTLPAAPVRQAIGARRGAAAVSFSDRTQSTGSSGTPGTTAPPAADNSNAANGKKPPGTAANEKEPTDGIKQENDGVRTAKDIIDGDDGQGTPNNDSASNSDNINGTENLNQLDGLIDCDTGEPFNVRLDGTFTPPDGWENADTPPDSPDPDWMLGKYWFALIFPQAETESPTPSISGQLAVDYHNANVANPPSIPTWTFLGVQSVDQIGGSFTFDVLINDTIPQVITVNGGQGDCTTMPPSNPGFSCPIQNPGIADPTAPWPGTKQHQLSLQNGQFVSNTRDGNTPPGNLAPKSNVDFCFDGGDRRGTLSVTSNGGFSVTETNLDGSPKAEATTSTFDKEGKKVQCAAKGCADKNSPEPCV